MASIASVLNHAGIHAQAATPAIPSATAADTGGSSGSNAPSNISSNDFLTLLVTELKNQDPTANADPNQYVNQLVQVNSLEQLIQINQTLSADSGNTSGGTSGGTQGHSVSNGIHASPEVPAGSHVRAIGDPITASGNLSAPATNPAADRVSHALDGRMPRHF